MRKISDDDGPKEVADPERGLMTEIGRRLQAERRRLELTQAQLAAAMGVSRITLASYEGGRSAPDLPTLTRGSRVTGLDIVFLATGMPSTARGDGAWSFIRGALGLIKERLRAHGLEVSPVEEADIVRDLYLVVMGSAVEASDTAASEAPVASQ
jgi:transcriptional regulator with XRE-family HTH domain